MTGKDEAVNVVLLFAAHDDRVGEGGVVEQAFCCQLRPWETSTLVGYLLAVEAKSMVLMAAMALFAFVWCEKR